MDRNVSKNGFSVGPGRKRLPNATTVQPAHARDAGKDLVEKVLVDLDRSFQEHGHKIFHNVMIKQPKLYFRALVMLARVQHRASRRLSELDRQRNRTEALRRLEQL